ncbi:MAG: hypothetical protein KGS48_08055 [Bacteroidetes bacterium]|nr:hypothetical protein [Bacteroidota bacterium]
MAPKISYDAFILACLLLLATNILYYPKWKKTQSEATISWDVAGYYLYLPAVFIYKDLKDLSFYDSVYDQYAPGPKGGDYFRDSSGAAILKYPMGQALQMAPFFGIAHIVAPMLGYPADGYSRPYQAAISWGSLLVAFLGLWVLRRVLLFYFGEIAVAATLIALAFGSNYLEYTAITGSMTHNWLFTLYVLLIYATIRFYQKPSYAGSLAIGLLVAWAGITRPTELLTALIPICWGISGKQALLQRWKVLQTHYLKVVLAVLAAFCLLSLQALYWKYVSGHWIVYSYQDQGFNWLHPHLRDVLISAKAGWWVYSPIMLLVLPGFFALYQQQPKLFPTILSLCMLCLYVDAAWNIWWYGGSLGQRALIQSYPLWAFSLAALANWSVKKTWRMVIIGAWALLGIYLNLWWTHQAHWGGNFLPEQMNTPYVRYILGRWNINKDEAIKLLDVREVFSGERTDVREIARANFEQDSTGITRDNPLEGQQSAILDPNHEYVSCYSAEVSWVEWQNFDWIRASTRFKCLKFNPIPWQMTQFTIRFWTPDGKVLKDAVLRLQRHVQNTEPGSVYFDTRIPKESFNKVQIFCWNAGNPNTTLIDEMQVELFKSK